MADGLDLEVVGHVPAAESSQIKYQLSTVLLVFIHLAFWAP